MQNTHDSPKAQLGKEKQKNSIRLIRKEKKRDVVKINRQLPLGTSLVVQQLKLCPSDAGGAGSIPGWRTKIPHALKYGQKKKKRKKIDSCPKLGITAA